MKKSTKKKMSNVEAKKILVTQAILKSIHHTIKRVIDDEMRNIFGKMQYQIVYPLQSKIETAITKALADEDVWKNNWKKEKSNTKLIEKINNIMKEHEEIPKVREEE